MADQQTSGPASFFDSNEFHTPFGLNTLPWHSIEPCVTPAERAVLRELAAQVAELAARPIEAEKRELWYRHNALQGTRPIVFCDPEVGWREVIPLSSLQCQGDLARVWEIVLRKEIFWGTQMKDDRVILDTFVVPHVYRETDWGLQETKVGGAAGTAYTWEAPLRDYATDLPKLRFPTIEVDHAATQRMVDLANDVLGDRLRVQCRTGWWWSLGMTTTAIFLRGLGQFMLDMMDEPDQVHRLMAFLRDGQMARLDFLQSQGLLSLNSDGIYVGSGGFGWSHELPQADFAGQVRTIDMWGFAESQETVGVSPGMFAEFILPYQLPILERFGLNCYGCCEPLDKRWPYVQRIPRLRRVSVSAWASVPAMAEMLGHRYIFSWKPAPSELAMETFDEEGVRKSIRETLRAARNCHLELLIKDTSTIRNDPARLIRWVEIAREEIGAV